MKEKQHFFFIFLQPQNKKIPRVFLVPSSRISRALLASEIQHCMIVVLLVFEIDIRLHMHTLHRCWPVTH